MPIPMRAANSTGSDTIAAGGVSSVNTDQMTTDQPSTRCPPKRVDSTPAKNMHSM